MSRATPGSFRLLFIVATVFLVGAALYTSVLIVKRQQSLYAVSRYNATWLLSQAAVEVARLEATVGAASVPDSGVDQDKVQLWLGIVENRVRLFDSGEVSEFLQSSPELSEIAGEFRSVIAKAKPLVATLDQPGHATELMHQLNRLNPKLVRLASAAYRRSGGRPPLRSPASD